MLTRPDQAASPRQTLPVPVIGMRRRTRTNGEPYLHATIGEDLLVPAGSTLDLRRLHDGSLDSPEFALLIVAPAAALSRREVADAAHDRLDGAAIRTDARDAKEPTAW